MQRKIELLSPAKNAQTGIEAINHGADAVYIGAGMFSARANAANSLTEIEQLIKHAHRYHARVYAAVNTILKDEELPAAKKLIRDLYEIGADAIIVQDMGILGLELPPIELHASTQMDTREPARVKFLEKAGFSQIVLARESTLDTIREVCASTKAKIEVFVHGALCVSYSGQCYMSQALCGRSANRGECAQFCRLPYNLSDNQGNLIEKQKHLLSLKDLNLSGHLDELLDAGVSSLKIEGRLKDVSYVKNITALYRQKLDAIFEKDDRFIPASHGRCTYWFIAQADKSFSRGFTDYYLEGRKEQTVISPQTPKSMGEYIGRVSTLTPRSFRIDTAKSLSNADGLCFIDQSDTLIGFRLNKYENGICFPLQMPQELVPGVEIFRNYDHAFEKLLEGNSGVRKIPVSLCFGETEDGFSLQVNDQAGFSASVCCPCEKQQARAPQTENIVKQLEKLGTTLFEADKTEVTLSQDWFVPSSLLSQMRRDAIEGLLLAREDGRVRTCRLNGEDASDNPLGTTHLSYLGNVMNKKAEAFFLKRGVTQIDPAFEKEAPGDASLMFTKHCLKFYLGACPKHHGKEKDRYGDLLYLSHGTHRLKAEFDCRTCMMTISRDSRE